jgi:hypothetical protein
MISSVYCAKEKFVGRELTDDVSNWRMNETLQVNTWHGL